MAVDVPVRLRIEDGNQSSSTLGKVGSGLFTVVKAATTAVTVFTVLNFTTLKLSRSNTLLGQTIQNSGARVLQWAVNLRKANKISDSTLSKFTALQTGINVLGNASDKAFMTLTKGMFGVSIIAPALRRSLDRLAQTKLLTYVPAVTNALASLSIGLEAVNRISDNFLRTLGSLIRRKSDDTKATAAQTAKEAAAAAQTRILRNEKKGLVASYLILRFAARLAKEGMLILNQTLILAGKATQSLTGAVKFLGNSHTRLALGAGNLVLALKVLSIGVFALKAALAAVILASFKLVNQLEEMSRSALKLNVSIETFQKLDFAAKASGTSVDLLRSSMRHLVRDSESASKLGAIGIDSGAFASLGTEDRVLALADAFAKVPSRAQRANLAISLFGEHGLELIPLLENGRVGIEEYGKQYEETGNLISSETAKFAGKAHDEWLVLKATFSGAINKLAVEGLPLLSSALTTTTSLLEVFVVPTFNKAATAVRYFTDTLQAFGLVSRQSNNDNKQLAQSLGLTGDKYEFIKQSLGGGRGLLGTLKEYFTTTKDINTVLDEGHGATEAMINSNLRLLQSNIELAQRSRVFGEAIDFVALAQERARNATSRTDDQLDMYRMGLVGAVDEITRTERATYSLSRALGNTAAAFSTVAARAENYYARLAAARLGKAFASGDIENMGAAIGFTNPFANAGGLAKSTGSSNTSGSGSYRTSTSNTAANNKPEVAFTNEERARAEGRSDKIRNELIMQGHTLETANYWAETLFAATERSEILQHNDNLEFIRQQAAGTLAIDRVNNDIKSLLSLNSQIVANTAAIIPKPIHKSIVSSLNTGDLSNEQIKAYFDAYQQYGNASSGGGLVSYRRDGQRIFVGEGGRQTTANTVSDARNNLVNNINLVVEIDGEKLEEKIITTVSTATERGNLD